MVRPDLRSAERLRELRLTELQQLAESKDRLRSEGHGVLATLSASRLMVRCTLE
jgi:hypothetical protein